MRSKGRFVLAAFVLSLAATSATSQTVTPIEFPGAAHTRPHGINSSGEISGIYVNPDNSVHSFLLDRNGFTPLDVPGAIGTNALRINPEGEIVGFYVDSSGAGRGFLGDAARSPTSPCRGPSWISPTGSMPAETSWVNITIRPASRSTATF